MHRNKKSSSNIWSELHDDILIQILGRLPLTEIIRLSRVSRPWRDVARHIVSSSSHNATIPWLMQSCCNEPCFFSKIVGRNLHQQNFRIHQDYLKKYQCIGSSHGWLLLMDNYHIFLLNPFSNTQIPLPHLKECSISKAILSSSPSQNRTFRVIVIYDDESKLGYWMHGSTEWKQLEAATQGCYYEDIICNNNRLHAISNNNNVGARGWSLQVWDFHDDGAVKSLQLNATFPDEWLIFQVKNLRLRYYLVESSQNILAIARIILHHREEYTRMGEDGWIIWRVDCELKEWIRLDSIDGRLESIDDRVLFLGSNHSISLSAQEFPDLLSNTIYFTEDPWFYGKKNNSTKSRKDGAGFYNVSSKHTEYLYSQAPSIWVVPNPW